MKTRCILQLLVRIGYAFVHNGKNRQRAWRAHHKMPFAIETEGLVKIFRSRWSGKEVRAVDGISLIW